MLFNSYLFVFVFLPVALAGFFVFGRRSRSWALAWLILASLGFYAWWRPVNVLIIAPAVVANYAIARLLLFLRSTKAKASVTRGVLLLGIALNIAFLGYFKYANFAGTVMNDLAGTHFVLTQVILPLGISFITFQKIAFLIDVHGGRIESVSFRDFSLFVLFFPQLVAGPIVHYREMMPQFRTLACRADPENLSVGLTLFVIGLCKKVVLADGIAAHVTPIYELAAAGGTVTLLPAWIAAAGFTLQIYFDFSGYSDMALGIARCFGVRLPANFDSPLKATNIVDFWLRWHMTLTRFLTAYVYNPIVLWRTRRRLAKGLPVLRGRQANWKAFLELLAVPTIFTMLLSGLWHGAGYLFLLWGLSHGLYLVINHAWRVFGPRQAAEDPERLRRRRRTGAILTLLAVAFSMVLFRSSTAAGAAELLLGMTGLNGLGVPQKVLDHLGPLSGVLQHVLVAAEPGSTKELMVGIAWTVALLLVATTMPNSLEFASRYEPAIGVRPMPASDRGIGSVLTWSPSPAWALAVSALAAVTIVSMGGHSEFLYWQF